MAATGMEELKNLLAVAAAGLWIVFSTITAPLVIQKMISEGGNAGAAFLSGAGDPPEQGCKAQPPPKPQWPPLKAALLAWLSAGNFDADGNQIKTLTEIREEEPSGS